MLSFDHDIAALATIAVPGLALMHDVNRQPAVAVIKKRCHRADYKGACVLLGFKPELITKRRGNKQKVHRYSSCEKENQPDENSSGCTY
jgi:hypothetical protein